MSKFYNFFKKNAIKSPKISGFAYGLLKVIWKVIAEYKHYSFSTVKSTIAMNEIKKFNKNRPYGPKKYICYAAFNNLHFQMNGDVSSCCFNYDLFLGNIYKSTLKEIWFGDLANNFRITMAEANMDRCLSCKNSLLSENYNSFPGLKYDFYSSDIINYPTQMSFELSNLCNYACIMCNEDFSSIIQKQKGIKSNELLTKDLANLINQLDEFIPYLKITTFIGGEPLLIKEYFSIWERIILLNEKCKIHIQTNGSVINQKFLNLLESKQFEIGVSLDSINKRTFEMIRLRSKFDVVWDNFQTLLKYYKEGKITLNINFCPLTVNWHELPEMVEFANKYEVVLKVVSVYNPRNLALQHQKASYLKNVFDRLSEYIPLELNNLVCKRNINVFYDFLNSLKYLTEKAIKRESLLKDLYNLSIEELESKHRNIYFNSILFSHYSLNEKIIIFEYSQNYINTKCLNVDLYKLLLCRLIQMFEENSLISEPLKTKNIEKGYNMFNNIVDEYIILIKAEN